MTLATRGRLELSANRDTYWKFDEGTNKVSLVINDVEATSFDETGEEFSSLQEIGTPDGSEQLRVRHGGVSKSMTTDKLALFAASKVFVNVTASPYNASNAGDVDATTAINAAITACNAAGGGRVYLPAGTYLVSESSGSVAIAMKSDVWLCGDGPATIIKLADGADSHVVQAQLITNFVLSDFQIDGNRTNQTAQTHGIRLAYIDAGFITRCIIHDTAYYGIGAQHGQIANLWIDNNSIYDTGGDGMDFKNKEDTNYGIFISNISIRNIGLYGVVDDQTGIDIRGPARISNVSVYDVPDGGFGVRFREGETSTTNGLGGHRSSLTGFDIRGAQSTGGAGVYVGGRDIHVSNGYVYGMYRGAQVLGPRSTITGVSIEDPVDCGFSLQNSVSADIPDPPDDVTLVVCHVKWSALGGSSRGYRLAQGGAAARQKLIGCTAANAAIGVLVNVDSTDAVIDGGDYATCTAPISDAGTGTTVISHSGGLGVSTVFGGSANSANLTLKSTSSGTPTSDYVRVVVGGAEAARFPGGGQFVSGHTASVNTGVSPRMQVHGTTSGAAMGTARWDNTSSGPSYILAKSRGGAAGTLGIVSSGDTVGTYDFSADDGTAFRILARVAGFVDGTPGAGDMPGRLAFYTSTDGGVTLTERMRISNAGNVGIGQTSFGTSAAKVLALGAGTAPTTAPADAVQLWVEDANGAAGKGAMHMMAESGTGKLIVPGVLLKATTGDPSQVHEGLMCINTFDKTAKLYADGGWRTIASGW